MAFPATWNAQRPESPEADRMRWICRLVYAREVIVGVDIKSHQVGNPCPYPAIVAGNEAQDEACSEARSRAQPPDVHIPSGGHLAFVAVDGRMVTEPIAIAVRRRLRDQADNSWKRREIQGKVVNMCWYVYTKTLDLRAYTQCTIAPRWQQLALPIDGWRGVDLSKVLYRAIRAVGGGWTESLHSDPSLHAVTVTKASVLIVYARYA